ncbi:hypothetical protein ig2599ANME_0488 [groundwater metagenome]
MSEVICFTPPPCIAKELDAISELGIYKDKNDFILDAISTMLSAHRELRIAIACKLYEKEEISLGKASEIVGVSIEETKKVLSDHGIKLKVGTSISETKERAGAVLKILRG